MASYQYTSANNVLTPIVLDFSLWGQVKLVLCSSQTENEHTLHQRNFYACQTVRDLSGTSGVLRQVMIRSVLACCYSGGEPFEHLL